MKLDEIKDRLMKMKALANTGVGGERANAEKLLAEIAARYGISLEELNGEEIEKHEVKITQHWQKKLLAQLAAIMRQENGSTATCCVTRNLNFGERNMNMANTAK